MCRAWATPTFGGAPVEQKRSRLQSTTTTVLCAWCASVLAAAGFSKAVDDPPLPGLHAVAGTAYDVGTVVVEVTAGLVLVAGFVFWLGLIVPALRARRREVAVPALAPALIVFVWLGVTALVALFAHHVVRRNSIALTWPRGALVLAVLVTWIVITVACVAGCAAAATLALRRARCEVPLARRVNGGGRHRRASGSPPRRRRVSSAWSAWRAPPAGSIRVTPCSRRRPRSS